VTSVARRAAWLIACAVALLVLPHAASARTPAPPTPTRFVTDNAGFLSATMRDKLDAQLEGYERRTGHQVLVYIGATTGDVPLEDYTVNAFAAWKVGRKGLDDGLVLFVFAQDHKVRIEVGYGLEPVVTDAAAAEIVRNTIVPEIRAGDNDAAVSDAVSQLLATIDGSPAPESSGGGYDSGGGNASRSEVPSLGTLIFIGFIVVVFIIVFIRSPGFALWLLFTLLSGGRGSGGGFSGGGGGFSGGGGRSGGGGASGSW
jgi:uncharacterized protein